MDQANMDQDALPGLYRQYLQDHCSHLSENALHQFQTRLTPTHWESPESAIELNNFAVVALVDAEQSEDLSLRAMQVNLAVEALESAAELGGHPLCDAHLALAYAMTGDSQTAMSRAFNTLLSILHLSPKADNFPLGLIYLPSAASRGMAAIAQSEQLQPLVEAKNGYQQAQLLLTAVMRHAQMVFYNSNGLRFLQHMTQFFPMSSALNLQLGLSSIMNKQWEGLTYLNRALELSPKHPLILQALYLAYRDLGQLGLAQQWQQLAHAEAARYPDSLDWRWTTLEPTSSFTYLPFDATLTMAVEASFRSIVTGVLLAESDWFEYEMEFWRTRLKPGMTVIDVGANVGVYTFSAANQVGQTGRVFAVEPFSGCVQCLEETCRVNQLDWVTVLAGAASDRPGTAQLSLHSASELNELVMGERSESPGNTQTTPCFTLDSLIEQEHLTQIDWLKIDAEGHEMQVLSGSEKILTQFKPGIIYENVAGQKSIINRAVAEKLMSLGYTLFRYQPFAKELIPIPSTDELVSSLNIVALPH